MDKQVTTITSVRVDLGGTSELKLTMPQKFNLSSPLSKFSGVLLRLEPVNTVILWHPFFLQALTLKMDLRQLICKCDSIKVYVYCTICILQSC